MRDYLEEFLVTFGWENLLGKEVDAVYFSYVDYCRSRKIQYFASRNGFARQMINDFGFKIERKRVFGQRKKFFA